MTSAVALLAALALLAPSMMTSATVTELTDADFDSELEGMDTALVMFYAPWCGHCKRLKPEFEKASSDLLANDPPVNLVKVDCTEGGKDTCGRFEVRGYPTLKIFRSGEMAQDYNGPREAGGITKYMKAQVGPASVELKSKADLDKLREKGEVVVVSFHTDKKKDEAFQKAASALRENVAFGHFVGSDGPEKDVVVLYRPKHLQSKLEPDQVKYDGEMSKSDVTDWIKANYHGLVGHRTFDNAQDFKEPLVVAYYDVDYVKNVKGTNYWRNRVMKAAKEHGKEKLSFAVSNGDDFQQEKDEFGLPTVSDGVPRVVIRADGKKYVMQEEFSVDALKAFLDKFDKGEVDPYLKSEAVPEDNDSADVKVAVAKNFDDLVTNSDKDSLIEFYAPWCGHCKKLAPIYDELGAKLKGESGVQVVKMDATANDVPSGFDVRGFPTLFWLPKNGGKPESYNGGREVDDFLKFIAEKATDELAGFDRKGKAKKTEL